MTKYFAQTIGWMVVLFPELREIMETGFRGYRGVTGN